MRGSARAVVVLVRLLVRLLVRHDLWRDGRERRFLVERRPAPARAQPRPGTIHCCAPQDPDAVPRVLQLVLGRSRCHTPRRRAAAAGVDGAAESDGIKSRVGHIGARVGLERHRAWPGH